MREMGVPSPAGLHCVGHPHDLEVLAPATESAFNANLAGAVAGVVGAGLRIFESNQSGQAVRPPACSLKRVNCKPETRLSADGSSGETADHTDAPTSIALDTRYGLERACFSFGAARSALT